MRSVLAPLCAALLAMTTVQAAPDRSRASKQLEFGVQMALNGSWREAAFRFQKAIRYDPDNPYAHNNLGVALETIGDFEGASRAYARALEMLPDNERIRENKERLEAYLSSRNYMKPVPIEPDRPEDAGETIKEPDGSDSNPEEGPDDGD